MFKSLGHLLYNVHVPLSCGLCPPAVVSYILNERMCSFYPSMDSFESWKKWLWYHGLNSDSCCLRNRSAPAVNCWVIIHCLEVSCEEDQITSAQREWFIFVQLTDKQWIITQQFTQWCWSIAILTHNKRPKHIRSLQLLPTFRHCTEELPPILRLRRIRLHVIVTSFKRKNDVTPSNAINDVIFQWRQLSHTLAVNYCPIYHRCYRWLYRRGVLEF